MSVGEFMPWSEDVYKRIFTMDQILCVYSGWPGCRCGCLGFYKYTRKSAPLAERERGYAAAPADVDDGFVGRVIKMFNNWTGKVYSIDGCIYVLENDNGREYAIYTLEKLR